MITYDHSQLARALEPAEPQWGALSFRRDPDDFFVEEMVAYPPAGEGTHFFLWIEKVGLSTEGLVNRVRQLWDLDEVDVGTAGRKDAQGRTRQRISVPDHVGESRLQELDAPDLKVLQVDRHPHKLRMGHHHGNRFQLVVRGELNQGSVQPRADDLLGRGMPNYYGPQRFGIDGGNLQRAQRFVSGQRRAKGRRDRFLVSVYQSVVFNRWLDARMREGLVTKALPGDLFTTGTGARVFTIDDPQEVEDRMKAHEVVITGPMYGKKMRRPQLDAMTWESQFFENMAVSPDDLDRHPAFKRGTRRNALVFPGEFKCDEHPHGVTMSYTLPPGVYATVFLEELFGDALVDEALAAQTPRGDVIPAH